MIPRHSLIIWSLNAFVAIVALAAFLIGRQASTDALLGFLVGYFYVNIAARIYFGRWLGS